MATLQKNKVAWKQGGFQHPDGSDWGTLGSQQWYSFHKWSKCNSGGFVCLSKAECKMISSTLNTFAVCLTDVGNVIFL